MEQKAIAVFHYFYAWAAYLAAFAVEPSSPIAHAVASYAILSPLIFFAFYVLFHVPMIVGDGLTRNIPFLGILFYRVMAFGILILVSQFFGFYLAGYLMGQGLLGSTFTITQVQYGLMAIFTLALTLNSYKKLENLLSATFYWRRTYGLLDGIALGVSAWLVLSII